MIRDPNGVAVIALFSKLCLAVALVLAIALVVAVIEPYSAVSARFCAAGSVLGLATLIGWRIARWRATASSGTIGLRWYMGSLPVAVSIETGIAGYLATSSLWRFCFLALAGLGAARALWLLALTVFFTGREAAGRRKRKSR